MVNSSSGRIVPVALHLARPEPLVDAGLGSRRLSTMLPRVLGIVAPVHSVRVLRRGLRLLLLLWRLRMGPGHSRGPRTAAAAVVHFEEVGAVRSGHTLLLGVVVSLLLLHGVVTVLTIALSKVLLLLRIWLLLLLLMHVRPLLLLLRLRLRPLLGTRVTDVVLVARGGHRRRGVVSVLRLRRRRAGSVVVQEVLLLLVLDKEVVWHLVLLLLLLLLHMLRVSRWPLLLLLLVVVHVVVLEVHAAAAGSIVKEISAVRLGGSPLSR